MADFLQTIGNLGGGSSLGSSDFDTIVSGLQGTSGSALSKPTVPWPGDIAPNVALWQQYVANITNGIVAKGNTVTGSDIQSALDALKKITDDLVAYIEKKHPGQGYSQYPQNVANALAAQLQGLGATLGNIPAAPSLSLTPTTNWALWLGAILTAILLIYLLTEKRKQS